MNYYRSGSDSVAWHADKIGIHEVNPIVAIVSLGGPRTFDCDRWVAETPTDGCWDPVTSW